MDFTQLDLHDPETYRREHVEGDPGFATLPAVAQAHLIRIVRNEVNEAFAKKRLFIAHGWPDHFDVEGFRKAREEMEQRTNDLEHDLYETQSLALRQMLDQGLHPGKMPDYEREGTLESSDIMRNAVARYDAFLVESAGEFAV
jgi:hypothetical protein